MDRSIAIYTGRVVKKHNSFSVKAFEFQGRRPEYPLEGGSPDVAEEAVITFTLEPGSGKALFRELLALPGSARWDLYGIIEKNRVTISFPEAVMQETLAIQKSPALDDPGLADFTGKPFITIDYQDSFDLDQAIYIEKKGENFLVYYALADGGFYIKPGSALFAEALERGTSYYLPGITVPMLPRELSEGIVSLNPDADRRAFVFIMEMEPRGEILEYRCLQGRIRSRAKLTYNGVQEYYEKPGESVLRDREFTEVLDLLKVVGECRIRSAGEGNQVQFQRKEIDITCTPGGEEFVISLAPRNKCSLYNEQISLMCNMTGARFLMQDGGDDVQGIYRIHQSPGEEALRELSGTLEDILKAHGMKDPALYWQKGEETLSDYVDRLHTFKDLGPLIEALERQVLISMRRSMFTDEAGEHFGLATNPYSRFSSPMREIVGIFIHKEALEKLGVIREIPPAEDRLLRDRVIESGNRSREKQKVIEGEVVKCAADRLFKRDLDLEREKRIRYAATILGIKKTRLYVRLDSPPIELKVYTEDLLLPSGKIPEYSRNRLTDPDTGKTLFKPGDRLTLYVDGYRKERWRLIPGEKAL